MPYVILDIEDTMTEALKGHLKGAFSEKDIAIGEEELKAMVFGKEIMMRDYVTLQSFLDMELSWGD